MKRDEIIGSVRSVLTSLWYDEKSLTESKVATLIEDRVPGVTVTFDSPHADFHITGSAVVDGIDPVQFRIAKSD